MESILSGLNSAQLAAVTSEADVLQILAPPGSGKTRTLTARVAYLLHHRKYQPWNVIVATFTVKAAREMSERIGQMIGGRLQDSLILGTFHSIARRYLVRYGQLIDIKPGFGIADSSDSLTIAKRIIKRHKLNIDPKVACNRISHHKARGISLDEYLATHTKKSVDVQEFGTVFEEYETALRRSNTLDFNDLLLRCRDLLRDHPQCVSNVEAVLIDEFQDTNVTQFELLTLLAAQRKRISTVGDTDQSIYAFRCADIKNLQRMRDNYPDSLTIHLEENYRSSGAILLSALAVIQQDESRPNKTLLPTHCVGSPPVLRKVPSSAIEATWIVQEITRMVAQLGGLVSFKDTALLIRSASLSRPIETALTKAGIPYRICGGRRFFERAEIKILLDYLTVIGLPDNSEALARTINVPPRKIGETTVNSLLREAEARKISLWRLIQGIVQGHISPEKKLSKAAEQGLGTLFSLITKAKERLRPESSDTSLVGLIKYLLSKLAFSAHLQRAYPEDVDTRQANVDEFIAQALEISAPASEDSFLSEDLPLVDGLDQSQLSEGEETLSKFLSTVLLSSEIKSESEDVDSDNKVTISTIHAAKGLEWPVVFVPGAYEGSIPHSRAEDSDEERRLLYVAMTRAQALLYLCYPMRNSLKEETTLSPFLSCKSLKGHLMESGPSFNFDLKDSISRILDRPMPSQADIEQRSMSLPSLEDDVWPVDGSFPPTQNTDRVASELDYSARGHHNRLQNPSGANMSSTLGTNTTSFSTRSRGLHTSLSSGAPNSLNTGFVTVGSHLGQIEAQTKQSSSSSAPKTKKGAERGDQSLGRSRTKAPLNAPSVPGVSLRRDGIKRTQSNSSQTTLVDHLFNKQAVPKNVLGVVNPNTVTSQNLERLTPSTPAGVNHNKASDERSKRLKPRSIPLDLGTHAVRASPIYKRRKLETAEHRNLFSQPQTIQSCDYTGSTVGSGERVSHSTSDTSALQAPPTVAITAPTLLSAPNPASSNTGRIPQKTLGIRRSMNGWSSRGHKPLTQLQP
ncbi:MAG: hypothetical protein M4579_005588 [Chaenotheca gracillima]|nr:MAG: hypothetical protein M4579_005588 [Chaenotheca gracillima]